MHGDPHQHVFGIGLGVLHEHVEVSVLRERAGVEQLVLEVVARPPGVGRDEIRIGVLALRIFVQTLHVGVGRRAIEVEVVLLDVLAVIPLAVGQSEQALLQDRIALVPHCNREAQLLLVV